MAMNDIDLIMYKGNDELIVTTAKNEKAMLDECFGATAHRDERDYVRVEPGSMVVQVTAHLVSSDL